MTELPGGIKIVHHYRIYQTFFGILSDVAQLGIFMNFTGIYWLQVLSDCSQYIVCVVLSYKYSCAYKVCLATLLLQIRPTAIFHPSS